ncbi:MAG: KH domain-containing protein [archaeon]
MKKIISEKLPRIIKNRKKLEKELNIKIKNRGREITITGAPVDEYIAEKVIEAIEMGFPISTAMLIKSEGNEFEIINIKNHTKRKDLKAIRARIIGKKGKTLKILQELTQCNFEIKENSIGIIGEPEYIKNAQEAIIAIINGAKQSNVYAFLEKHQVRPVGDFGLK